MDIRAALLLLILALCAPLPAGARERDPEYDRILAAYKAGRHEELDRLADAFLEAKPDYKFCHSIRFMVGDSLRKRKRLREAAEAFEEYLARHAGKSLEGRARLALLKILNEDRRPGEALARAEAFLEAAPTGRTGPIGYERALALEELRRFPEAADAYRSVTGKLAESSAYRVGVSLFRGREFEKSRAALASFLRLYPESSFKPSARDYLFRTETGFSRIEKGIILDYRGKYESDERFTRIRDRLGALRASALAELEATLGIEVPRSFLIRFADAGADRSGNFASTRLEVVGGEPRQVVVLFTEYLVLGAHDLSRTLVHELFHCLQRERLGEDHFLNEKWVREGAALFVAGQARERTRLLAVEIGRRTNVPDPLARLVNGLGGRHTFEDYAEDVAAFTAAEARHGREAVIRLVLRLLETTDEVGAVKEVLDEDFPEFDAATTAAARAALLPLLEAGRKGLLLARQRHRESDTEGALAALAGEPGAYAPAYAWLRAQVLLDAGRDEEALRVAREEFLAEFRRFPTLLDDVLRVEARAAKRLETPDADEIAARAMIDLEPLGGFSP